MNLSDLFDKLIAIDDPVAQKHFLEAIEVANPEVGRTLREMLANYCPSDPFLETPAAEQLAQQADGKELLNALEVRFQAPKRYSKTDLKLDFLSPCSTPGTLGNLAGYDIYEIIGHGGSGIVLRAKDPILDKWLAIKVMHADQVDVGVARQRFMQEARALAKIDHENIVRIYRVEEYPLPFLVMELVKGSSLDQWIENTGGLELDRFLSIATQIARGLAVAHEHGLVHRDVKPGNILITGTHPLLAKITDFGLARQVGDLRLTVAGAIVGTPLYMSPDQIKDEKVDYRSDLFSLGIVYYEMITGEPPFRGSNHFFVMNAIVDDEPASLISRKNSIPDSLERIILKLLEKDPCDRYQSAKGVIDALELVGKLPNTPIQTAEPENRRHLADIGSAPLMIATGLVVTAAILALHWLPRVPQVMVQEPTVIEQDQASLPIPGLHPWVTQLRIPFDSATAKEYQKRWAELLGIEVEFVNSVGIPMVLVPPGEFLMGYPKEELEVLIAKTPYENEKQSLQSAGTPTWVRISSPFYMSKYEITEAERFRAIGSDHMLPSVLDLEYEQARPRSRSEEYPVTRVPWQDGELFCQRLSNKEQLTHVRYRLPTETEWEWACRGGRGGSGIHDSELLLSEAWIEQNSQKQIWPRGLKTANPFGIHDMIGNTQEWCLDTFHPNHFIGNSIQEPIMVDPFVKNDDPYFVGGHVLRGGAAIFGSNICNFSMRVWREQYSTSWFTGFRIVLPIDPQRLEVFQR